jgi:hypothetical protein
MLTTPMELLSYSASLRRVLPSHFMFARNAFSSMQQQQQQPSKVNIAPMILLTDYPINDDVHNEHDVHYENEVHNEHDKLAGCSNTGFSGLGGGCSARISPVVVIPPPVAIPVPVPIGVGVGIPIGVPAYGAGLGLGLGLGVGLGGFGFDPFGFGIC